MENYENNLEYDIYNRTNFSMKYSMDFLNSDKMKVEEKYDVDFLLNEDMKIFNIFDYADFLHFEDDLVELFL